MAVLVFLGYNWWQNNSSRIAAEEIKRYARNMVDNPDNLTIKANGIKIINKNNALINKVIITGDDISLKSGIKMSTFSLNINDTVFPIPIISKLTSVKSGYFKASINETSLTEYLKNQSIQIGLWKININNIKVDIKPGNNMIIILPVVIPVIAKTSIININGKIKYDTDCINFDPLNISISGASLSSNQSGQLFNAIKMINPIVKLDKIPFAISPQLSSTETEITLKGNITGLK